MDQVDEHACAAFANAFAAATGRDDPIVEWFGFGDTAAMQTNLGLLVPAGSKRATAGWLGDDDADESVEVGDLFGIVDGEGLPLAIIETTHLRIAPLDDVSPAFAWDEGENDRTRESWYRAHKNFFDKRAARLDITFDPSIDPVLYERFTMVWPDDEPNPWLNDGNIRVRPMGPDDRPWVRTLLGTRCDDLAADTGGWSADRCPGLVARDGRKTVGYLGFVPSLAETAVFAVVVGDDAPDAVAAALREGLDILKTSYGWGAVVG